MSFDFDEIIDRRNSDSAKWKYYAADILPAWVADMDFRSPPALSRALHARIDHEVFGYAFPGPEVTDSIVTWAQRKYGWTIIADDIVLLPGLVSGLNLVTRAFGHPGDSTITLTPIYGPMMSASSDQGMQSIQAPLTAVRSGSTVRFEIDFDAFERAITARTTLFMMCQPHNPAGREFTREELARLGAICQKRNVLICSDEIHGDLMLDGRAHTVFASLSPELADRTITLMAPSKTFNVPGLGCSIAIVQNAQLRQRLKNSMSGIIPHVNLLGLVAAQAAFTQCDDWLAGLQAYLTANRDVLVKFVAEHMPGVATTVPEATYLAFLDFRTVELARDPYAFFMDKAKVALSSGLGFGKDGAGFARLNFGCPRSRMLEVLERLAAALPA